MALVKWKKDNETFPAFTNWMDEFFNDDFPKWSGVTTKPSVNVKETNESYDIEVAVPGFTKGDFNIDVDNDILTISADKESKKEEEDEGYTRREFNYASFKRSFTLPDEVNVDEIKGSYKDGILHVALPKKEEAATPKKTIKVS